MKRIYKTKWGQYIDLSQIISIVPATNKLPIKTEIYVKNMYNPIEVFFPIRVKKGNSVNYEDHMEIVKAQNNDLIEAWKDYINPTITSCCKESVPNIAGLH